MQLGNAVITPAGDNSYGQLGDGSQSARFNSTGPMTFSSAVIASANSLYHSAVVLSTGATYVWGNNSYYECGVSTGGILANATASLCAALSGYFAVDVACGTGITLILTSTGTVVALGTNLTGMLGNGSALNTTTQSSGAVVVTGLTDIKAIGAGENHAYAIDGSGYLWLWGANTYGQFGNGTITTALVPVMIPMASTGGYGVIAASVGYGHTLIINTNNACMAAGLNYYGQLGMFTNMTTATANSSFATVIFPASSAGIPCETYPADVACGMHHSIVLMANGTIRCFGLNDKAQLGLAGGGAPSGTLTSLASYPPLVMTANTTVISAASYGNGTYVASASSIDSAGFDAFAAFSTRTFLTNNAWLSFYSGKYSSASYIGSTTTIAGSTTYYGEWLQLQLPAAITLTKLKMANYSNTPATGPNLFYVMGSNNGTTWVLLGTFKGRFNIYDGYGTYYLTPTTATYSYFRIVVNSLIGISIEAGISQLLLYAGFACCSTPVKPYQYRNVCSISASVNTTYIEPVLGREMASYNSAGTNLIAVFTKVRSYGLFEWASGEDIIGPISISDSTSVLVTKSGNVHTWGNNANGQLGNNTIVNSSIPIGVSSFGSLANMSIIAIACGSLHTVAVDTTGKVHSWGANGNGQLGNNTVVDSLIPIAVSGFGYLVNAYIVKIACGYSHTVALDSTGKVYSWGYNNGGQLGNNGTSSQNQAILTSNYGSLYGINIVQIAAGYWHTVALDSTGKVHAWGYNGYGQLGNNTITNSSIPIAISSFGSLVGTSIVAIATGGDNGGYIVALDSTGKVHSWGYNGYGQLGNNTLVRSLIPIAVSGFGSLIGTSIVAIACGIYHTIALDSTGKVHSWGYNGLGQLGNNTVVNSSIPIAVSGYGSLVGKSIVAIACGFYHTIALDSFGTVHAWGYNNNGQLGNNTVVQSMIPIFINFGSLSTGLMGSIFWNFTGQHRCFVEGYSSKDLKNIEGLVVCANRNKYVTTDATTGDYEFLTGAKAITTNDALPVLSLANKSMDKTAFGVVSLTTNYNPAPDPTDIQLRKALEEGDQRAEINAVGEGGMWICDAGGNLESGDYITTSMIPGYGMRQIDDCIRNYTVAKITMDCDFNPPLIPDQTLCKDAIGNNILDEKGMPTYSTVLTPPIYSQAITTVDVGTGTISNPEQTLIDAGGQPVLSPAYKMRYLNLDGSQITEEEYNAAETTQVYKAAFVGCTYHCG
jgi:alpha-tubulin suppressor-like RCC1 family protein